MAYYRRCGRCGCTMDVSEGSRYPGEGLVCEECSQELDVEEEYRRHWCLSKEQLQEIKKERTGFRVSAAEGIA